MQNNSSVEYSSEWRKIYSDPWLLALVSWLPPLCFLLIYGIFSQGLARDLPIGIVDLDQSQLSRQMTRYYEASPTLAVASSYLSPADGISALRKGDIYGLILIPPKMEKDAILGHVPQVEAFYNNQFLLMGKLVKSAVIGVHTTVVAQVDVAKSLSSKTTTIGQAIGAAIPISTQMTPLFNLNNNYAQFLVSAIIPATWQIFIVMTSVLCLALELRRKGLVDWLGMHPLRALVKKFIPYTLLFWGHGVCFLVGMFVYLDWPMHGQLGYLMFCQLLTVCACQIMGALIFFLTKDSARSLGISAAYAAPGLAFMGVTFPVTDMTTPAQIWRSLLPASHYVEIQIAQTNYGVPLLLSLPQLQSLVLFAVPAAIVCFLAVSTAKAGKVAKG